jgi:hypothetical protein
MNSNNIVIPDYDGYKVILHKNNDTIYIKMVNILTHECYKKTFERNDFDDFDDNNTSLKPIYSFIDLPIKMNDYFILLKKSFMKENNYIVTIDERYNNDIYLDFKTESFMDFVISDLPGRHNIPNISLPDKEIDISSLLNICNNSKLDEESDSDEEDNISTLVEPSRVTVRKVAVAVGASPKDELLSLILFQNMLMKIINTINSHYGTTYSINDIEKCKRNKDEFNQHKCIRSRSRSRFETKPKPKYENIIGEKYRLYIRFKDTSLSITSNTITNSFYIVVNTPELHENYIYEYYNDKLAYASTELISSIFDIPEKLFDDTYQNMSFDEKNKYIQSFISKPNISFHRRKEYIKNDILKIFNTNKYKYNARIFGGRDGDVLNMDYEQDDGISTYQYFIVPMK